MKKEYKSYYDNITPNDELLEAIFDGKKKKSSPSFRPALAAALCLVLVATGCGVGFAHSSANKNEIVQTTDGSSIVSDYVSGGVLVAYAGEGEPIFVKDLAMSQAPLFYKLTVVDLNAPESEIKAKKDEIDQLVESLEKKFDEIGNQGKGVGMQCQSAVWDNVQISKCSMGEFMLDVDDYENVESVTLSTESKYGEMELVIAQNDEVPMEFRHGDRITVSGEELLKSQQSGHFEMGIGDNEINKGCEIMWEYSDALGEAINANPDFDLAQIKDTLTFEVKYKNGDISNATVNISFDSDGNMNIQNGTYNYYKA